jgi:hypothetical protein
MSGEIIGLISIGVGLFINVITLAFWAGTLNSNIKHLSTNVRQLNIDAAVHHDKQESSLTTMWTKHDALDKRVVVLETKCVSRHGQQ